MNALAVNHRAVILLAVGSSCFPHRCIGFVADWRSIALDELRLVIRRMLLDTSAIAHRIRVRLSFGMLWLTLTCAIIG